VPRLPRLPRKTKADVTKCHACHAKVDVTKRRACDAKYRGVTVDQARPSAPPELAQCQKCHACHAKRRWMSPSATPAMRSEGGCHQLPRLPSTAVAKCHACRKDGVQVPQRWCVNDGVQGCV